MLFSKLGPDSLSTWNDRFFLVEPLETEPGQPVVDGKFRSIDRSTVNAPRTLTGHELEIMKLMTKWEPEFKGDGEAPHLLTYLRGKTRVEWVKVDNRGVFWCTSQKSNKTVSVLTMIYLN